MDYAEIMKNITNKNELLSRISNFYYQTYQNALTIKEKTLHEYRETMHIRNTERILKIVDCLANNTQREVLIAIIKLWKIGKEATSLAISKLVNKHLATILPHFQPLEEAGLIVSKKSTSRGRGGKKYEPLCDKIEMVLSLSDLIGNEDKKVALKMCSGLWHSPPRFGPIGLGQ